MTAARKRWIIWGSVAALVIIVLSIPSCYYIKARSYPAHWAPLIPDAPMARRADALERRVTTNVTLVREGDPTWQLEVTADQMNEWLAARLPRWLANQGAGGDVGGAMVLLKDGELELAIEAMSGETPWLVRLVCDVLPPDDRSTEDAPANFRIKEILIGKLPVSFETVVSMAGGSLDAQGRQALDDLAKGLPMVMDLGDGRIVTVLEAKIDPQRARLTCRTKFVGRGR